MQTLYADHAAFYRTALLLGLLPGARVVEWADHVIANNPHVPRAFMDIATTPPADITALRNALLGLCTDVVHEHVLRGILGLVQRDFESVQRNFHDSVTVLIQIRQFLKPAPAIAEQLRVFEVQYFMAQHDGNHLFVQKNILNWLNQFKSFEKNFQIWSVHDLVETEHFKMRKLNASDEMQ